MRDDTTTQPVVFKDLFGKPVVARFDQPDSSSDVTGHFRPFFSSREICLC
jgi:hypothetical protein